MIDEGYIKFDCNWIKEQPLKYNEIEEINRCRDELYSLGLIGAYDNGIGFGNISIRRRNNEFIVSGSATGNIRSLDENHYTTVTSFNIEKNKVVCKGPIKASSESLTHAMVYLLNAEINAIIHVHDVQLWNSLKGKVPTTSEDVSYGTPQMAQEIQRLYEQSDLKTKKMVVMAGHKEGIITFGKSLNEAKEVLLKYCHG